MSIRQIAEDTHICVIQLFGSNIFFFFWHNKQLIQRNSARLICNVNNKHLSSPV